ncbi:MAG: TadE/TadG family type IV pilus assembly protein, partial [Pyrinomonadaceae bacterium]
AIPVRRRTTAWGKLKRRLRLLAVCEDGTQLIEFAIALPFLLLMFAGSVEIGRMFYTYTTLTKSTMVGAQYLSSPMSPVSGSGYSAADINIAKNLMICGVAANCNQETPIVSGLAAGNIIITAPPVSAGVRYVTVQVTYNYTPLVFDLGAMTGVQNLSLNYTLTPQTKMRYMLD